jgi:nifR3 family TIM-barrel protein
MVQIGSVKLKNWLVMAPMAGITDLPFRRIVKRFGPGLLFTEMISAAGLAKGQKRTYEYLNSHAEEKPLAVQIFSDEPDMMAAAGKIVVEAGADIVDINMGCPVKKVVKTGAGGALLRNPGRIKDIVSALRRACDVPVTVKMRAGWSPDLPAFPEIVRIIEGEGADAITVHPRYVTQGFSGQADWAIIARIKDALGIPVIGNGDVFRPYHALDMKNRTGCDAVMIARGAVGNPWIFEQILLLERGLAAPEPELAERKRLIKQHFQLLSEIRGERRAALAMRGLLLQYTKGLPHSTRFRGTITQLNDLESLRRITDHYFGMLRSTEE